MKRIHKIIIFLVTVFLLINGNNALADHDEHRENRHGHREKDLDHVEHNVKTNPSIVNNPEYKENCGACHFVYQPDLLPSGSWNAILNGLENHFGEAITIDPNSLKNIFEYLTANAADLSSTEHAKKIMKSLGNQTPLRVTETSYIQKEHREISKNILNRKAIGSLSNCSACHTNAEKGIYDDDNVTIPD